MPIPPMPVPTPDPARIPRPPEPAVNPPTATVLRALAAATDRLLATIDAMPADAFAEPSLLPRWTRGHVIAHLALNAKGLTGVLTTLGQDNPLPLYPSVARRDSDIDRLAAEPAARIADRVAVGSAMLAVHLGGGPAPEDALESVGSAGGLAADVRQANAALQASPPAIGNDFSVFARAAAEFAAAIETWSAIGTFDRTPGGPVMQAAEIPLMRWREVEIHHADLDFGYGPRDWPAEFATYLLDVAAYDRDGETRMTLFPTARAPIAISGPERGTASDAGPEIHGAAADLAWWLVGRGSGEGLSAVGGELPVLGPWVRRP